MANTKGSGGGKLNRSEILQARLDPKLRFAADIMARYQRRTISSLVEFLIDEATQNFTIPATQSTSAQINRYLFGNTKSKKMSIKELTDIIWSSDESNKFALFALYLPQLLTSEEEELWEFITSAPYFWEHFAVHVDNKNGKVIGEKLFPVINYQGLIKEHLNEHWPTISCILRGNAKKDKLMQIQKLPPGRQVQQPKDYPIKIKKVTAHD